MRSAIKATVVRARLMQAEAWAHPKVISQVWAYVGNRLQVWLNLEAPMTPPQARNPTSPISALLSFTALLPR